MYIHLMGIICIYIHEMMYYYVFMYVFYDVCFGPRPPLAVEKTPGARITTQQGTGQAKYFKPPNFGW